MVSLLRVLLVATALLGSGVLEVAAALADDACCEEERGASCPDCPPGLACACCPMRGVVQEAAPRVRPAAPSGVAFAAVAAEPRLGAAEADIFHPPRA